MPRCFQNSGRTELIKLARRIKEYKPKHTVGIVERVLRDSGLSIEDARIAVLGVAYKGGVDDTRDRLAKYITRELLDKGAKVAIYDQYTSESFGAKRTSTLEEAVRDADAIVVVTDHPEFKNLDLNWASRLVKHKITVDGRRAIDPYKAIKYGFKYYGIGYGRVFKL